LTEARELQNRSSRPRLLQLDALRGLAAVTVIFHHFRASFSTLPGHWFYLLVGSGSSAVVLFFVLSGYVLSLPAWAGTQGRYSIYVVRRVCRIYLPFAAAALISIGGDAWFRRFHPHLTTWYLQTWQTRPTVSLALKQLTMWPMPQFNTAFWSLYFEMQMSLGMPVLCAALKRWNAVAVTVAGYVGVYGVGGAGLRLAGVDLALHPVWGNVATTLHVMCHFLLGATLARYDGRLGEAWRKLGGWRWLVLLMAFEAYWDLPLVHARWSIPDAWSLWAALGSAGIIVSALHLRPMARLLEHRLPEYLGRVSYSVYLMHGIVLFGVLDELYGRLPVAVLLALVLVGSLTLGHLFCVTVEEPAMRLGKRLAERMKIGVAQVQEKRQDPMQIRAG
jgi:peptidoglycan/LPS O-acetylase OafA/YrhL